MNGNFGYVKAKDVGEKEYKRLAMQDIEFTNSNQDLQNSIELNNTNLTRRKLKGV